ncbi:MAG TPA: YicC/YloC family endoribonuclease [Candidatus Polarisedimenticolia bacterium]|nr:YicC/YloC family endoribonuclease [Candidatus Polarisedimenticolia bacterium]
MSEPTRPIRSMTGFGQGAAERDGVRVDVELKGVNHRFLDVKMKLPAEAGLLEPALRSAVQERVSRGRIDVNVAMVSTRPSAYRVNLNRELVAGFLEAAADLKKEFRLKGSVGLEALLALPGAIAIQAERAGADVAAASLVPEALRQALARYDTMRAEEGRRLAADLRDHLAAIRESARRILAEARGLPEAYARRLKERLALLLEGERSPDESRLAQEVALLAGRVDITEELVRLQGYLDQADATLDRPGGPVGKTLDFIMQEMNREANTISSKAEALPICQEALRIKAEVEKIREQVQNLE